MILIEQLTLHLFVMLMVRKHFAFDPGLEEESHKYFMALSDKYLESKEFANARFVRNLYERTWSKAALRCSLAGVSNIVLTREDFIAASGERHEGPVTVIVEVEEGRTGAGIPRSSWFSMRSRSR